MSDPRWSIEKITDWHNSLPWLRGCNYIPANAINEIEMWAAKTFDPATLDRELGWAAGLGFNVMRVYLHDQVWADDAEGFKKRIDEYLTISDKHGIKTFFVLFDDCWHEPELGVPAPRPGIHNSGWLRSPGRAKLLDEGTWGTLEAYVRDIVTTFKNDPRIVAWDIYNEVTNLFLPSSSLPEDEKKKALETVMAERAVQGPAALKLMELAFGWVRDCDVSQPLTAGIYYDDPEMNPKLIALSDFVSFHHYKEPESLKRLVEKLQAHGRPLWCTEYLNRREGCFFETHLPVFKEHKIAAFNWGFVDGKTQTKFAWWDQLGGEEPEAWFHDVVRADGTPFSEDEARLLKEMAAS